MTDIDTGGKRVYNRQNLIHPLLYKQHFYKAHQAEIGKKLGKS